MHLNYLIVWEENFPAFAAAIEKKCRGLFSNCVAFTDGHFQRIAWQGGLHNVYCQI